MFGCVNYYSNVVVCIVAKKNGTIDMVWSVGLEFRGGEFQPWLEQKT